MEEFKAIKKRSLYQDIVGQIHDFIRDGVLKPGDRLPAERELAERLEVGRSSVREAIRALELQGLVVSRPGAGTFVTNESLDTLMSIIASTRTGQVEALNDIFEVRHLLEPQIAGLAAQRATPEDIRRMEQAVGKQELEIASGESGVAGDTAFHFALAQATQNWALMKVMPTITDVLKESRDQSLQTPGRPERSLASHKYILETIVNRDAEGARSAMEHHISEIEPSHVYVDGVDGQVEHATAGSPT